MVRIDQRLESFVLNGRILVASVLYLYPLAFRVETSGDSWDVCGESADILWCRRAGDLSSGEKEDSGDLVLGW